MDEDHRTVLKKNFGQLQDIIFTSDFLGKLHQYNVLPDDWIELIKCQTTESEKRYMLATLMPKSGPDTFHRFVLALSEQYWWIAEKLKSDLQELKTSNIPQTDSTLYIENGIQCDLYSAVSENINQEKFQLLYDKIQSLVHLTDYKMKMKNKTDKTDLFRNHGTITFECLEEGMNDVIQQANQLKINIDLCYKITGRSGEELHVLLQEKEEKTKHQCKDFESKIREKEMENQNLRKKISELDSEILRFKYEMALKQKKIIDLKQTLQTNTYHREKHKTLDELKRILASQKCNPDLGDGLVSNYSPINATNDPEKYCEPSRSLGKSQAGTGVNSIDELSLTHRWLEKLHQLLQCEMRQEMQVHSNMDCSQISRDTIETAICNLLEKNKQLEEKIEEYEQQKLDEVIPSVKDQPGTDDKSKDELFQTHRWLETLHQRIKIEMCHEGQGDSSTDCSPISRDTIDNDVSKLLERKQQLEEKIEQLKLLEVVQSGKSQDVIHDVCQEELTHTHWRLKHQNHRQQFEMVLDGPAEFIMDCSQVLRDTIDADKSNLVEIKDQLDEEMTPSGKSRAGAAERDQDELHPKNRFENIIPVICYKCEGDNNMDCSSVFPHDNGIYVVEPRQQPMEGKIEQLGQLNQAEETTANKKFVCITIEQKSKPESGLDQLEIQVTATKVEPSKKTPLEHKNKRHLKPHGPVFFVDKRQVPQLETPKEKQTRPHQPPLKRRTTKPKTKTQR